MTIAGGLDGTPSFALGTAAELDLGARCAGNFLAVRRAGFRRAPHRRQPDDRRGRGCRRGVPGTIAGTGGVEIHGTLRLAGNAAWPAGVTLVNRGLLDIMTWQGDLPPGFINHGTVLDRSQVKIDGFEANGGNFKIRVHGYSGHAYTLQWSDDMTPGSWRDASDAIPGADAPIEFTHPGGAARGFYRVHVSP